MTAFVAVTEHMRGKQFSDDYGDSDGMLTPAENEDHRQSRFLIFKKRITSAGITAADVQDLFEILEAKIELEGYRNERLNKFVAFIVGFGAALSLNWMGALALQQIVLSFSLAIPIALVICAVLWGVPSRKEKLRELRYFMRLFEKGSGKQLS